MVVWTDEYGYVVITAEESALPLFYVVSCDMLFFVICCFL